MNLFPRAALAVIGLGLVGGLLLDRPSRAQGPPIIINDNPTTNAGGVYIDARGMVRVRDLDAQQRLMQQRRTARGGEAAAEKLCYVSLPRLLEQVRSLKAAGQRVPEEMRFLAGMTQLRYVFVYPQERDLVIAGAAEPWSGGEGWQPVGTVSGRPVLQLDDFVTAMRAAEARGGFGCSIDMHPDSLNRSAEVMRKHGRASQKEICDAMVEALGPQQVRIFGTVPETRLAFACVAADYRLKRMALGIDTPSVAGVGHGVDNSRGAANRYWFEASYEPLLTTPGGDAFEIRGPRLVLKAGAQSFDPRGATAAAQAFTKRFSDQVQALARTVPEYADLQNIADLSLLVALIRQDKLDAKVQWDTKWLLQDSGYALPRMVVPRTTETLACVRSGSVTAGGVILKTQAAATTRQADESGTLSKVRSAPPAGQWRTK